MTRQRQLLLGSSDSGMLQLVEPPQILDNPPPIDTFKYLNDLPDELLSYILELSTECSYYCFCGSRVR